MIDVRCECCKEELCAPGALVFGAPREDDGRCAKDHLCRACYVAVFDFLKMRRQRLDVDKRLAGRKRKSHDDSELGIPHFNETHS